MPIGGGSCRTVDAPISLERGSRDCGPSRCHSAERDARCVRACPPVEISAAPPAADYYTVLGYSAAPVRAGGRGVVEYCPVDGPRRATCAYGELTSTLRATAQTRGRRRDHGRPGRVGPQTARSPSPRAGRPRLGAIQGLAVQPVAPGGRLLGGAAIAANLITGTRTQNVGSTKRAGQYAGGMAYPEAVARAYLDSDGAGDSARSTTPRPPSIRATSCCPAASSSTCVRCDGAAVDERVEVSNTPTDGRSTTGTEPSPRTLRGINEHTSESRISSRSAISTRRSSTSSPKPALGRSQR